MHDVAILGAGPAGASAATQAAALGLSVVVIDEAPAAGGQVYRIAHGIDVAPHDPERVAGDALRAALEDSRSLALFEHRVWHVERVDGGFTVRTVAARGAATVQARTLIVATGAQERHLPVLGWQRPGVLGLAAATVLLKAQRVLPGREVVVAGAGPLLLAVAAAIVKGGARVAAIVDANPRRAWLRSAGELCSRLDLVARGAIWSGALTLRGVPWLPASTITSIDGVHGDLTAVVTSRAARRRLDRRIRCDAVCMGFGLSPATEATRALGADHAYAPLRGGWHVVVDDAQRTSVPKLFACGDVTGIVGAAAAPWSGRIAAQAAAAALGHVASAAEGKRTREFQRKRNRAVRFGAAMTALTVIADALVPAIAADAMVCLCERVTRRALDAAIDGGARSLAELRAVTRCGMGPCGGRMCGEASASLLALRTGQARNAIGQFSVRPPLRPVALGQLAAIDHALSDVWPAPA